MFKVESPPKHTIAGGELVLKEYFDRYDNDELETIANEEWFEVPVNGYIIRGRLDKRAYSHVLGKNVIIDHKTTSRLGQDFYDQCNPNGQFTTYLWIGRKLFDIDTLVVDGILTPYQYKTKPMVTDFERVVVTRTDFELDEWVDGVHSRLADLKRYRSENYYPKSDRGYQCTKLCEFRELCLIPDHAYNIEPDDGFKKREVSHG